MVSFLVATSAGATLNYTIISESDVSVTSLINTNYIGIVNIPAIVINPDTNITYNVTSIDNNAFGARISVTEVTIPSSVTSIGNLAFINCVSLISINIPSDVTSIGDAAFAGCTSLTTIDIPSNVTSIGASAFSGCTSLTTIDIPSNVTSIGASAFSGCTSLTTIDIPSNVTSIGASAFSGCTQLEEINIPNGVNTIDGSTFQNCTSLTTITIPSTVETIKGFAFYGCTSLITVTIPNNVTSIKHNAFSGCTQLEEINIPSGVTSIMNETFNGCSNLTNITIPDGVTSIGDDAFYGCNSFTIIAIPDSVENIGNNAFLGCNSLYMVYFGQQPTPGNLSNILPTLGTTVFNDKNNIDSIFKTADVYNSAVNISSIDQYFNTYSYSIGDSPDSGTGTGTETGTGTGTGTETGTGTGTGGLPAPTSNVCFPAGTPIATNQGLIPIEKINPDFHTIRNKKIVAITKTVTQDKYLVAFEKNSLGRNMPCERTVISKNHLLLFEGEMIPACIFVGRFHGVSKVAYKGETLYNVLLEQEGKMMVNNLICETLDPTNIIAQLYRMLPHVSPEDQLKLIKEVNKRTTKKTISKMI